MRVYNFFKPLLILSYDQKCSPFGDHTNISHDLKLLNFVKRLTIHKLHPLATLFW